MVSPWLFNEDVHVSKATKKGQGEIKIIRKRPSESAREGQPIFSDAPGEAIEAGLDPYPSPE
jgi:hypothetical protein